jgi:hypothetical protein
MLKEALHDVESMDAYDPAVVTGGARKAGAARWLDVGYLAAGVSATPMSAALADAEGTSLERQWVFPINDQALVVQAFRLDLERLVLPTDRTYAAPRTIEVLARFLERSNRPDAAAMFADRIVAVPAGEEADAALARLRAVAGSP